MGDVKIPRRSTKGSAGYDFYSPDTYELKPNEWTVIDTGISFDALSTRMGIRIDQSSWFSRILKRIRREECYIGQWFILIAPKSGLGTKYGFRFRNTIGIVDSDYHDTIKAVVTVDEPYTLNKGEKFMQGIIIPYCTFDGEIEPTEKRNGGHGSTGRY